MLEMNFFARFGIIIESTFSLHEDDMKKMMLMSGGSHGEARFWLCDQR